MTLHVTAKSLFSIFGVTKKTLYIEPMLHHYTKNIVKLKKIPIIWCNVTKGIL